ncbi:hypothetical protein PVAND_005234 [Polypedilum vanderplanki]|uniref:Phosphatidylinositol 3,4,5-trisphosphate 3-phosphatase and dual-specificity protein phosphatase PTEN n=1 Tax=Polypedilum vanderplanki TaxID=319348 RepID=A0A9J6C0I4_POLVA|nr:hypothetical protein PVAND_005234 [Polypedilum vanderplanki]
MTNAIKGIVSKRKKRYKQDGFNLDLTYICDNIIAMGYPAKNLEGVYRNHIDDVKNFLTLKHDNNYKIYNLCEEKKYQYDITTFQQCASFPFSDHNPPRIELISSFCNDLHKWLSEDSKNVAAIHCKAGKGRTGTMICCYLLHSGQVNTAADALNLYGQKRTTDKKGVTIPSQRRYVEYYAQLLKSNKPYEKIALNICEIKLHNFPQLKTIGTLAYSITVEGAKVFSAQINDSKQRADNNYLSIKLDRCLLLVGDVKIEFSCTQILKHKQKLFHYWFNTFFISQITQTDPEGNVIFELNKPEIDDAHKDKQKMFNENFKIETIFQKIPHGSNHINRMQINGVHNNANSRYSNLINNNNNNNNNDINQHQYNTSRLVESQNSDNQNHYVNATLRNASSSQRNHQLSTNEIRHSRGDEYQTTSEGSSSPESSSESSAEEWESGNSQNDSKPKYYRKRLNSKTRKKSFSQSVKIRDNQNDDILKGTRRKVLKKYTTTSIPVEKQYSFDQSKMTIGRLYNKNNNCSKKHSMENNNITKCVHDSETHVSSNDDQRSTDSVVSLVTRLSSLFQRRGNDNVTATTAAAIAKPIDTKHTANSQTDFNKVRNELKQFQKGFDEQKKYHKADSDSKQLK